MGKRKDEPLTKVIFKTAYYLDGEREVMAFFPGASANPGNILCYAHCGQHSECSYDFYLKRCLPCRKNEDQVLKKELENIFGYRFRVVKKISRKDLDMAWKREVSK